VLKGAPELGSYAPFRQDNNFYYLTGVETPNALLMLDASAHRSILFLPRRDKNEEKWDGPCLFPGAAACAKTGMDDVLELSSFWNELEKRSAERGVLYIPLMPQETAAVSRDQALQHESARQSDPWDGRIGPQAAFEKSLRARLGESADIRDLSPLLDDMRRVKDACEIELLRRAARISALGLAEAMRSAHPGMVEYQLAALAEFVFLWHGAFGPAFFPIVGSGPNSCLLHYHENRRTTAAGDIVLFDFGCDYAYYAADIARTFPISGRFSKEQARVYRVVLEAQKAAIGKVRPGATFNDLGKAAQDVFERHDYRGPIPHGVSHYVGMSVHDVGAAAPFEAGVVIAVEPGIYLPDKNLGIRIEDTVLVTEDGCEILTGEAPKEISDIEKLMAEKGITEAFKN